MKKLLLLAASVGMFMFSKAQTPLLSENFDYPADSTISGPLGGWFAFSGQATNPLTVTSPGLSFAGYSHSNIGNKVSVKTTGADACKDFSSSVNSGNVYAAFMINVSAAQATGDYFAAFLPAGNTSNYSARLNAKSGAAENTFDLGLAKGTGTPTNFVNFNLNTTYLVVLKYAFDADNNDSVSAYVFTTGIPATEPTAPTLALAGTSGDASDIGRFAIRQGSAGNAATLDIDGIKVVTSWADLIAGGTTLPDDGVTAATALNTTELQETSAKINFTTSDYDDNANQTLVFLKEGSAITQGTATAATSAYTANTDFANATSFYQNDAAAKCILNSDAKSVTVTGLTPGKTYHALVYVVRDADSVYSSAATISFTTVDTTTIPEVVYSLYNIGDITSVDPLTGIPDSMGVKVMLRGVAVGFNQNTSTGITLVVNDATGGTTFYHPNKNFGITSFEEGDSVYVKGAVTTYNGLHEINIDTIWKGDKGTIVTPILVTAVNEFAENRLVRINGVRFVTQPVETEWPSANRNYTVVTPLNDTITIRTLSKSGMPGVTIPTSATFDLIGIGAQFTTTPAAFNGYQVYPRVAGDIIETVGSIAPFDLITMASNSVITVEEPIESDYVFSWTKPATFGAIDSVIYKLNLDTLGGDFTNGKVLFTSTGNIDDTTFTITEATVKTLLETLNVPSGTQYEAIWNVTASFGTIVTPSAQTFRISLANALNSGVKENAFDNKLSVYPNPSSSIINIAHTNNLSKVEVYNHVGQLIQTVDANNMNAATVNVSNLAKGLYFINVYDNNGASATRKVIVQ